MSTMLAPGVSVELVDPGVLVVPEVARVTLRNATTQGRYTKVRWLVFEENGPGSGARSRRIFVSFSSCRGQMRPFFETCDLTTMTPDDLR